MRNLITVISLIALILFNPSNLFAATLSWSYNTNMPTARFLLGVAADSSSSIYAVGGADTSGSLATVEKYSPISDSWVTKANLNVARNGLGVAWSGNKLYAIGGNSGDFSSVVEEYDPSLDSWTSKTDMPTPRTQLATVADSSGNVFAVGGSDSSGPLATVEEYDPSTDSWTTKTSMNFARAGLAAAWSNGKLYTFGGNASGDLTVVEEYDPSTDSWTTKTSMPTGRYRLAATVGSDGHIFVIGGSDFNGNLNTVEEYDPSTDSWVNNTSINTARSGLGAVTSGDKLYAIGGNTSSGPTDVVEEATAATPPTTLTPSADSYIKQGSGNENEGASSFIRLQQTGHNRGLVKFDESQIQAAVGSYQNYTAKIKLTISDNGNNWGSTGRTINIHRLTQNWVEGNGFIDGNSPSNRGTGSGTTWNCASDSNISNSSANCSGSTQWEMTTSSLWPFISSPTASTNITNNQSGVIELDVTADVQSFISNTNQNYGWILKKDQEGSSGRIEFGSKESMIPPQLVITKL